MTDEKTVTNIAIRASYDSIREIVGEKAGDMIFKSVGLEQVLSHRRTILWTRTSPTSSSSISTSKP